MQWVYVSKTERTYMYIFTPLDLNVGTFLQDKPLGA